MKITKIISKAKIPLLQGSNHYRDLEPTAAVYLSLHHTWLRPDAVSPSQSHRQHCQFRWSMVCTPTTGPVWDVGTIGTIGTLVSFSRISSIIWPGHLRFWLGTECKGLINFYAEIARDYPWSKNWLKLAVVTSERNGKLRIVAEKSFRLFWKAPIILQVWQVGSSYVKCLIFDGQCDSVDKSWIVRFHAKEVSHLYVHLRLISLFNLISDVPVSHDNDVQAKILKGPNCPAQLKNLLCPVRVFWLDFAIRWCSKGSNGFCVEYHNRHPVQLHIHGSKRLSAI